MKVITVSQKYKIYLWDVVKYKVQYVALICITVKSRFTKSTFTYEIQYTNKYNIYSVSCTTWKY